MAAAELLAESDVGGDGKGGMAKRSRRQRKTKQSQGKLDPTLKDLAASWFLAREAILEAREGRSFRHDGQTLGIRPTTAQGQRRAVYVQYRC